MITCQKEANNLKISISELKSVTALLFDHLQEVIGEEIEIDHDYYWNIPKGNKYDSYDEPVSFTIGQLTEDWDFLLKILEDSEMVASFGFVWLSAILRAIGEDVVK